MGLQSRVQKIYKNKGVKAVWKWIKDRRKRLSAGFRWARGKARGWKKRLDARREQTSNLKKRKNERIKNRKRLREIKSKTTSPSKLKELKEKIDSETRKIKDLRKQIYKVYLRKRYIKGKIKTWTNRKKKYEDRKAKITKPKDGDPYKIVVQAGYPHWGGADDILENEVEPIARRYGFGPNSAKRSYAYGNPSSDHYTGNRTASARDFPTASNYALAREIRKQLDGGYHVEYQLFYFTRAGHRYRGQIIAGTHGSGPHLHVGIRLVY